MNSYPAWVIHGCLVVLFAPVIACNSSSSEVKRIDQPPILTAENCEPTISVQDQWEYGPAPVLYTEFAPPVIGEGNLVYFVYGPYALYGLDPNDGSVAFTFPIDFLGNDIDIRASSAGPIILSHSYSENLFLDPVTSEVIGSPAGTFFYDRFGLVEGKNGAIYGLGSSIAGDDDLVAVDVLSGTQLWSSSAQCNLSRLPAISPDKETLYYACNNSNGGLWAIDAETGEHLWFKEFSCSNPLSASDIVVGANGRLFYNCDGIYALDASDGSELWHAEEEGYFTSLLGSTDTIFAVAALNSDWQTLYLIAFSADTGERLWDFPSTQDITFPEYVSGSYGSVYALGLNNIYELDETTGEAKWHYTRENNIRNLTEYDSDRLVINVGSLIVSVDKRESAVPMSEVTCRPCDLDCEGKYEYNMLLCRPDGSEYISLGPCESGKYCRHDRAYPVVTCSECKPTEDTMCGISPIDVVFIDDCGEPYEFAEPCEYDETCVEGGCAVFD